MGKQGRTILFQGDSITDCGRARDHGPGAQLGYGYVNFIASQLGYELAERNHRFINRGISGDRVSDLYARWNEDAISLEPDLLSILIGVNDVWRIMSRIPEGATDRFERAYRHLLAETKEVLPNTGIVLCEPFVLEVGATVDGWDEWRRRTDGYREIVAQLAEQYDAVFVPLQDVFDAATERAAAEYWLWDGVHPTAAGHELIARQWLNVVQSSRLAIE